jgi:chaperonin GroES
MNIRPLHDRIIVHRLEEGEQQIGGIIIPDTAKEKPQQGTVISVGNGKARDVGKPIPLDVKAGDRILFGKYAGQEVKLDGEEVLIMKEDDVLAVVGPATAKGKDLTAIKSKSKSKSPSKGESRGKSQSRGKSPSKSQIKNKKRR